MQKIKMILICLLLACCLCSCRERGSSEDRVSDGQQSNVGWFLFVFDNRSAQQQLVKDMADGNIPGKLTVNYYALKYDEDYSWQEVLLDDYTTVLEDKDLIRRIYHTMTNMIVVGQLGVQDNRTRCKLNFELQDGRTCAFTFETASIINIEGQNYVLESDGRLWQLLPNGFEVKDALKALEEVQAKEDAQALEEAQTQEGEQTPDGGQAPEGAPAPEAVQTPEGAPAPEAAQTPEAVQEQTAAPAQP